MSFKKLDPPENVKYLDGDQFVVGDNEHSQPPKKRKRKTINVFCVLY